MSDRGRARTTRAEFRSERIVLAALREAHADMLVELLSEPLLRRWLRAEDQDGLGERFRGWEAGRSPDGCETWLNWIVVGRREGEPLG